MMVWKFTGDVRENIKSKSFLDKLREQLNNNNDIEDIKKIIEKAYCLKSEQISTREIKILNNQIKAKGIDKFVQQFRQFAHLGFTPYIF
ncbi:hypothetical protein FKF97_16495 [Clostridium perfringens]|uniref:hypothetical protein n=1 Tax=Clostridium perfringens TaxID=1502 RepID=UPI00096AA108|nr:hypothetical protein [Clostridium perfringens]EGT3607971.1 hypothetical protein [Clostridium perfringens]